MKSKKSVLSSDSEEDPFRLERYLVQHQTRGPPLPALPSPPLSSPTTQSRRPTTESEEDPFYLEKYMKPHRPMMDRKIETKGLSSSFSANISRKTPSPKESPKESSAEKPSKESRGRSKVRAIVNWLENTSPSPQNSVVSTPSPVTSRFVSIETKPSSISVYSTRSKREGTQGSIQSLATDIKDAKSESSSPAAFTISAPVPEEYSLTLLKYRQYFNNRPLMRCLDDGQPKGDVGPRPSPTPTAESTGTVVNTAVADARKVALDAQVEEQMGKPTMGPDGDTKEDNQKEPEPYERDAEECRAFWDNVRQKLWIEEDELEADTENQVQAVDSREMTDPSWTVARLVESKKEHQQSEHIEYQGHKDEQEGQKKQAAAVAGPAKLTKKQQQQSEHVEYRDLGDAQERQENQAPSKNSRMHRRKESHWVMVEAPSKWSFDSSMADGDIYQCEQHPRVLFPPFTPTASHHDRHRSTKSTEEKLADFDDFLDDDDTWNKSQRQSRFVPRSSTYYADQYTGLLPLTRTLADIDKFLDEWDCNDETKLDSIDEQRHSPSKSVSKAL